MSNDLKLIPGFDDIIFKNRNQKYGAFDLRTNYSRNLLIAFILGILMLCTAVITPFIKHNSLHIIEEKTEPVVTFVRMERLDQPKDLIKVYSPPPPAREEFRQQIKYIAPEVVDTVMSEKIGDQVLTMDESVQTVQDGQISELIEYVQEDESGGITPTEEEVFFIVEEMPSFQGEGQEGFRKWIAQNLRYPEIAAENGISGKVYVQFAVNSRGKVEDAVVVRSVDPALDKEAVRIVMSSPEWEPGKQRGRPVKVQFTFPINFILQ